MNRSRITGAVLLRWEDCTSILSKHLTTLLQRPIQLCRMVEDYDYWCVASINGRFSIPELHALLDALSAATTDFPDLIPEDSDQTRSFSMEFSRALLQHFLHASWRYEHLTEEYLMVIDADAQPAYAPLRPLKHEYRKLLVENYMMLYWVSETEKRVTIARVVYARRDYTKLLE